MSVVGLVSLLIVAPPDPCGLHAVSESPVVWQPVTLDFDGLATWEGAVAPNPFLDARLQVSFESPSGEKWLVPGFFAGDGSGYGGSESSPQTRWRVRFTPDTPGTWTWHSSFRLGPEVAISLDADVGIAGCLDGLTGSFEVAASEPAAPGFLGRGRVRLGTRHYLVDGFGVPFIKGGIDSPENMFGYSGFDGTPTATHDFASHVIDWRHGDPDWDRADPPGTNSGRGLIGAINYLASVGMNSMYFLPMNVGGDGQDTWPWVGPIDPAGDPANDNLRFDISKMHQWTIAMEHAQRRGILLHFVLNEAEPANKLELDNAQLGVERRLFYRELVARFGYSNGVVWNICEEYNFVLDLGVERVFEFADYLRAVDPYNHPITVHNQGNPQTTWAGFLGAGANDPNSNPIDLTSLQLFGQADGLGETVKWFRDQSAALGKPIAVMIDEPESIGDLPDFDQVRQRMLWDILLSGGGVEWYVRTEDQSLEDFRSYEQVWQDTTIARRFLESLPVEAMEPADDLVSGESSLYGGAEVLAALVTQGVYAIYLPRAAPSGSIDLSDAIGPYRQRWFNPRTGLFVGTSQPVAGGGVVDLGLPPEDPLDDWVALILLSGSGECAGDINDDGVVDTFDMLLVLTTWGSCDVYPCPGDIDGDGMVGVSDMLVVVSMWGPCSAISRN